MRHGENEKKDQDAAIAKLAMDEVSITTESRPAEPPTPTPLHDNLDFARQLEECSSVHSKLETLRKVKERLDRVKEEKRRGGLILRRHGHVVAGDMTESLLGN